MPMTPKEVEANSPRPTPAPLHNFYAGDAGFFADFLADSKTLVSVTNSKQLPSNGPPLFWSGIRWMNVQSGQVIAEHELKDFHPRQARLSRSQNLLALAGQKSHWNNSFTNSLELRDARHGKLKRRLDFAPLLDGRVAISTDGTLVVVCGEPITGPHSGVAHLWNAATGKLLKTFAISGSRFTGIALSFDGKILAIGGGDRRVRLYNTRTLAPIRQFLVQGEHVVALAFAPNGRRLAVGTTTTTELWAVRSGNTPLGIHATSGNAVYLDDHNFVAGTRHDTIRLWDAEMQNQPRLFRGLHNWVDYISIAPDQQKMIAATQVPVTIVWNLKNDKRSATPAPGRKINYPVILPQDE